ncbi:MAG: NAD(P)H-dependent oxidoreductase subunit E [Bacteroidetes bacterium]|jgi:NADH-quinone oxidoreductase subunit E|nr:NAD(P)H-dependent oxidoreductase subunit E [Bacteroidota bacterium]MBT3747525.1 NAD(P)H-dependent oxidoreductase subunit E [Bacteroidota bacterium]MBT4399701.1 NAD(P)H-dependent oxidoreductase subunit E [Bacteroidota bacterium]MBT4409894.1 NAD(P)H-dependent oxidoreductase subunit E [Bacteroidota bacterium]MBT5428268.1 NAD(P)H-dependent oxidoreductase subunit E [Bacteroidota bacterium]
MADVQKIIGDAVKVHGTERKALMPILQAIVQEKNYLSDEDMISVANVLDLSSAEVFGTASFYTFLDTEERGEYVVRVCKTISCHMAGKDEVINALEKNLKIKAGETTVDKKFTLLTANCLGWCHKGPVMLVNDEVYPELTPQKAVEIIQEHKNR